MATRTIPGRRGSNSSGVTAHLPHGGRTVIGRHPDRVEALRLAESIKRMHENPNMSAHPLTAGEKATLAAQAEQLRAIAAKVEAA